MSDSGSLKPLPPLSPAALRRIQSIRRTAIRGLRGCHLTGTQLLDHDSALEVMRTYAIEELRARVEYYMALPGAHSEWSERITEQVVQSAIAWFPRNEFYMRTPGNQLILEEPEQFLNSVNRTVVDHLLVQLTAIQEARAATPAENDSPNPKGEREALRNAYQAAFPDVKIADICWAAGQSYREWRRWINGDAKAKDGSRPDRSFRHVLTSGKPPEGIMGKPRPIKYNV